MKLKTPTIKSGPAILHFPFLCLSSNGLEDIRPGIEANKLNYLAKDSDSIEIVEMNNFNIIKSLRAVMGK